MRINHNIAALNTYRQLGSANAAQGKSMEKLSSGLRINSAADDAAGLAISEKMRGQIRGLEQASSNSQDAISLVQTAEGALNETHDILQRMRELSVQSANDTNTTQDRESIQDEMDQLTEEIDRISDTTQFNTKNLLDGSMGKVATAQVNKNENASLDAGTTGATLLTALEDKDGNSLGIAAGDKITVSYMKDGSLVENTWTVDAADAVTDLGMLDGSAGGNDDTATAVTVAGGKVSFDAAATGFSNAVHGITITVEDSTGNVRQSATDALSAFTETQAAADARTNDGSATFQIGANTGQSLDLDIENMSSSALGVANLKVETQSQGNVAIKVIDEAIQKVSAERSKLGSVQNRLDHTINNLGTSAENLTAAESRIRDVDYALAA